VPWAQPWRTAAANAPLAMPKNASTDRRYSGINVLILWGAVIERGFSGQSWVTFRQALGLGGNVRKGERGTTVVYADRFVLEDERRRAAEAGEDAQAISFLKRFTVFNTDQCDGLTEGVAKAAPLPPPGMIEPEAESLIAATAADFSIGGARAFYSPSGDFVQVPPPQAYFEPINWHRTAFHEFGHWTGHASRLDCDHSGSFGSKSYAREELVAQMAGAFVCASRHRAQRPSCRLHRLVAGGAARGQSRHRPRCQRRVQGRRPHSRLSVGQAAACGNLPRD
jgi:antirestriction protein ArdC